MHTKRWNYTGLSITMTPPQRPTRFSIHLDWKEKLFRFARCWPANRTISIPEMHLKNFIVFAELIPLMTTPQGGLEFI